MLVGKQVALISNWIAETKCHPNSAVPHTLKGRLNTINYFTVSSEVLRASFIYRAFKLADCFSLLNKILTSLIITQHINE